MQAERVVETWMKTHAGFCEAVVSAKGLYDYFHVMYAYLRVHHRLLPKVATESVADGDYEQIFDAIIEFGNLANAVRQEMTNRAGHSESLHRFLPQLPNGERTMPAVLLRRLRVLPDDQLRQISAVAHVVALGVTCLRLYAAFKLSPAQAHSTIMLFASPLATMWPQALVSLPSQILDILLVDVGGDTYTASHKRVQELAADKSPIVIELVAAESHVRSLTLAGLVKAARERDVSPLTDVVRAQEELLWFLTSRMRLKLPESDFRRFDGSLNYDALLRETSDAVIRRDSRGVVVFEHASFPGKAFVVRYPASLDWFSADKSLDIRRDYDAAPLRFSRQYAYQRHRSIGVIGAQRQLEWLKEYAVQTALESLVGGVSRGIAKAGAKVGFGTLQALPEAMFAAGTAYAAMTHFGMSDAAAAAFVEGLVHLLVRGVYGSIGNKYD